MKTTLAALLLMASVSTYAAEDCNNSNTQAQLNACTARQVKEQTNLLLVKLTKVCEKEYGINQQTGGSMYRALINDCMATKLQQITKSQR